jgi:hypothetical protein
MTSRRSREPKNVQEQMDAGTRRRRARGTAELAVSDIVGFDPPDAELIFSASTAPTQPVPITAAVK